MSDIQLKFQLTRPGFRLDVALTLPGEGFTVLFGPSGSGKTSLLRCMAGLEKTAQGYLRVDNTVWQDTVSAAPSAFTLPTHRRPLGYVFQEASLFPHLNVLDNIRFGLKRTSTPFVKARGALSSAHLLEEAIDMMELGPLLQRQPSHLSGGERQRVAIARALVVQPRLLLMDEPLAALDMARKQEILPFLERLHAAMALPVVYVTHAMEEVTRLADYVVSLASGQVVAHGPLTALMAQLSPQFALGDEAGVVLTGQVAELDHTWHLMRVSFAGGSVWAPIHAMRIGQPVRLHVLAKDVSLAMQAPVESSIQNSLCGTVDGIGADRHPGLLLVRVRLGQSVILARLTKRAADTLGIVDGLTVWVQIKTVALLQAAIT